MAGALVAPVRGVGWVGNGVFEFSLSARRVSGMGGSGWLLGR